MVVQCQYLYSIDFDRTKLLPERGIILDNMEEELQEFHAWLIAIGWPCIAPDSCYANGDYECEFYVNLNVVSHTKLVINN